MADNLKINNKVDTQQAQASEQKENKAIPFDKWQDTTQRNLKSYINDYTYKFQKERAFLPYDRDLEGVVVLNDRPIINSNLNYSKMYTSEGSADMLKISLDTNNSERFRQTFIGLEKYFIVNTSEDVALGNSTRHKWAKSINGHDLQNMGTSDNNSASDADLVIIDNLIHAHEKVLNGEFSPYSISKDDYAKALSTTFKKFGFVDAKLINNIAMLEKKGLQTAIVKELEKYEQYQKLDENSQEELKKSIRDFIFEYKLIDGIDFYERRALDITLSAAKFLFYKDTNFTYLIPSSPERGSGYARIDYWNPHVYRTMLKLLEAGKDNKYKYEYEVISKALKDVYVLYENISKSDKMPEQVAIKGENIISIKEMDSEVRLPYRIADDLYNELLKYKNDKSNANLKELNNIIHCALSFALKPTDNKKWAITNVALLVVLNYFLNEPFFKDLHASINFSKLTPSLDKNMLKEIIATKTANADTLEFSNDDKYYEKSLKVQIGLFINKFNTKSSIEATQFTKPSNSNYLYHYGFGIAKAELTKGPGQWLAAIFLGYNERFIERRMGNISIKEYGEIAQKSSSFGKYDFAFKYLDEYLINVNVENILENDTSFFASNYNPFHEPNMPYILAASDSMEMALKAKGVPLSKQIDVYETLLYKRNQFEDANQTISNLVRVQIPYLIEIKDKKDQREKLVTMLTPFFRTEYDNIAVFGASYLSYADNKKGLNNVVDHILKLIVQIENNQINILNSISADSISEAINLPPEKAKVLFDELITKNIVDKDGSLTFSKNEFYRVGFELKLSSIDESTTKLLIEKLKDINDPVYKVISENNNNLKNVFLYPKLAKTYTKNGNTEKAIELLFSKGSLEAGAKELFKSENEKKVSIPLSTGAHSILTQWRDTFSNHPYYQRWFLNCMEVMSEIVIDNEQSKQLINILEHILNKKPLEKTDTILTMFKENGVIEKDITANLNSLIADIQEIQKLVGEDTDARKALDSELYSLLGKMVHSQGKTNQSIDSINKAMDYYEKALSKEKSSLKRPLMESTILKNIARCVTDYSDISYGNKGIEIQDSKGNNEYSLHKDFFKTIKDFSEESLKTIQGFVPDFSGRTTKEKNIINTLHHIDFNSKEISQELQLVLGLYNLYTLISSIESNTTLDSQISNIIKGMMDKKLNGLGEATLVYCQATEMLVYGLVKKNNLTDALNLLESIATIGIPVLGNNRYFLDTENFSLTDTKLKDAGTVIINNNTAGNVLVHRHSLIDSQGSKDSRNKIQLVYNYQSKVVVIDCPLDIKNIQVNKDSIIITDKNNKTKIISINENKYFDLSNDPEGTLKVEEKNDVFHQLVLNLRNVDITDKDIESGKASLKHIFDTNPDIVSLILRSLSEIPNWAEFANISPDWKEKYMNYLSKGTQQRYKITNVPILLSLANFSIEGRNQDLANNYIEQSKESLPMYYYYLTSKKLDMLEIKKLSRFSNNIMELTTNNLILKTENTSKNKDKTLANIDVLEKIINKNFETLHKPPTFDEARLIYDYIFIVQDLYLNLLQFCLINKISLEWLTKERMDFINYLDSYIIGKDNTLDLTKIKFPDNLSSVLKTLSDNRNIFIGSNMLKSKGQTQDQITLNNVEKKLGGLTLIDNTSRSDIREYFSKKQVLKDLDTIVNVTDDNNQKPIKKLKIIDKKANTLLLKLL